MVTTAQTLSAATPSGEWIADRRACLIGSVKRASTVASRLLSRERATASRLLALAAREVLDPDARSGFYNRCIIVVRGDGAIRGRFGLWEENGVLCLEKQIDGAILVLCGNEGELIFDEDVEAAKVPTCPRGLRRAAHGNLKGWRGSIRSVSTDLSKGRTIVTFSLATRPYSLAVDCPVTEVPADSYGWSSCSSSCGGHRRWSSLVLKGGPHGSPHAYSASRAGKAM